MVGILLAIAFGVVWLAAYWPPLFMDYWLWLVMIASAFLTLAAVSFIQIPLQNLAGQALIALFSQQTLISWFPLVAIPQVLLSGLVQEASKLAPVVLWGLQKGREEIDPRLGLLAGAVAGFGFGVFEAAWAHNAIFAAGWTWEGALGGGLTAFAGLWERFSSVAFHISATALAGYGLARGWGWQFYLVAAFLHFLLNYGIVPLQMGIFNVITLEIYLSVIAFALAGVILWLRWRGGSAYE